MARRKFGVKYPALYATKDHKLSPDDMNTFNCIQRAHQNTLETWAPITILTLLNGLYSPYLASSFMIIYTVGRIVYGLGYKYGGSDGRKYGALLSHLGDIPMLGLTFYNGLSLAGFIGKGRKYD